MSTIEIEIPTCADIYILRGILLRASATYCVGIMERSLWYRIAKSFTYKGSFWVKDLAVR